MKWGLIGTWRMSLEAIEEYSEKLKEGMNSEEAVEGVIRIVEDHPDYHSVGYSGLPNEEGEVEMDAAMMDGDSLSIGALAAIKDFKNPISIARSLMKEEVNNFLVGRGAEKYAHMKGFERRNMLTQESKDRWAERLLEGEKELRAYDGHDTVGVVGLDGAGRMVAGTSTSGLFMKKAGRVGDSPLVGSGFYADSKIGACTATGLGEDIMKGLVSYQVVALMGMGISPQEAGERVLESVNKLLIERRGKAGDISLVCMNKEGEWGAATNAEHFSFVVANHKEEAKVYLMSYKDTGQEVSLADQDWIDSHTE